MHLFEDLATTASNDQLRAVRDLQREIQIDQPAQMMFTSGIVFWFIRDDVHCF